MTDNLKDKRLVGASSLHGEIESLLKVEPAQRQGFVHDRLMSAIDDICETHKAKGNGAGFSKYQTLVLKDVAFHIVYLLDPLNKSRRGFVASVLHEFREASAIAKVGYVVSCIAVACSSIAGFVGFVDWSIAKYHSATDSKKRPSANSPSSTATPANSTPPQ